MGTSSAGVHCSNGVCVMLAGFAVSVDKLVSGHLMLNGGVGGGVGHNNQVFAICVDACRFPADGDGAEA